MNYSPRTKKMIRGRNITFVLSTLMWVGTAVVMAILAFKKFAKPSDVVEGAESMQLISEAVKTMVLSLSTTVFIGIIASIIIKDKIRTFMWMLSTVIAAVLFDRTGMLIVLALWLVEEYVIHALYTYYKGKVSINKEIDMRGF